MITVIMRRDQVIDARDSCILCGRQNPLGITHGACPGVSGINEHRLSGRSDKQHGIATFNIDDINI